MPATSSQDNGESGPDPSDRNQIDLDEQAFSTYPPYVTTPEERERWDLCEKIANKVSAENEPYGQPSVQFVWYATRELYSSEIPMGEPMESALDGKSKAEEVDSS